MLLCWVLYQVVSNRPIVVDFSQYLPVVVQDDIGAGLGIFHTFEYMNAKHLAHFVDLKQVLGGRTQI